VVAYLQSIFAFARAIGATQEALRNFKIGELAFRAGPYKQGHRALRIAKLHIVDDHTRLRCLMDEQPRVRGSIQPKP
jgi:hypothetical protein